jgi:flavin-binding protein dodecin
MAYTGEGEAEELAPTFRFDFRGEPETRSYFIGYSREGIDNAIRKAVDHANKPSGTTFVVTQIEVISVDDPNVGGYRVILTPTG